MGTYLQEYYPLQGCKGEKIMTVLIGQSFRKKSVYFEIYFNEEWVVYWNYEFPMEELLPIIKKYSSKEFILQDNVRNKKIVKEVAVKNKTYSFTLDKNEISYFQKVVRSGLPKPREKIRRGLDGHFYDVKLCQLNREYICWCTLPYEWQDLNTIINILVERANLDTQYKAYMCEKKTEFIGSL